MDPALRQLEYFCRRKRAQVAAVVTLVGHEKASALLTDTTALADFEVNIFPTGYRSPRKLPQIAETDKAGLIQRLPSRVSVRVRARAVRNMI